MRYLFLFLLLAVPLYGAAAQSVTLDNGTLTLSSGVVSLDGGTLYVGSGGLLEESGGRIDTTATLVTAPVRSFSDPATADLLGGLGFTITTTISPGDVTVTRGHTPQIQYGNPSIRRYYDVSATTNTGLDATVVFHYHEAELNSNGEADLVLFRSIDGGTTWTLAGGTVDTDANTITMSGVDSFARWTAAISTTPLPVELVTFEGRADGAAVILRWTTASETNNAGFGLQRRSASAPQWQTITFVEGQGTTGAAQSYEHRLSDLAPGTYRFRLQQVDLDGTASYSAEVTVEVGMAEAYQLTAPYPNPFTPSTAFTLSVRQTQPVRVEVVDALGRRVALLHDGVLEGGQGHAFTFEAADLPSGLYLVRAQGAAFQASRAIVLAK